MKIRLYYPAFDPLYAFNNGIDPKFRIQGMDLTLDTAILSGLVAENVALTDFDPETGALVAGPVIKPPARGNVRHKLALPRSDLITAPKTVTAIQILCFGTVMRTISLLESSRVLGRKIVWGFPGKQLFVVPRAGYQANAFYHRASHSVQFLLVPDEGPPSGGENGEQLGKFTALSPDIVAHETAHAVIDGIAPFLYEAATPQSLALHEAVADLTALFVSLRTNNFVTHILDKNNGALDKDAIGQIAEEIGSLSHPKSSSGTSKPHGLRNLSNRFALPDPETEAVPEGMLPMFSQEPHDLSEVLSGAMFRFLVKTFEAEQKRQTDRGVAAYSSSGYSLFRAVEMTTAIVYRALDYLPPGEISFADFARAMLAADKAFFPDSPAAASVRDRLVCELKRRNIKTGRQPKFQPDLSGEDLSLFAGEENDWRVYDFVNRYKGLFRIPDNTPFRVHPPMVAERSVAVDASTDEIEQNQSKIARHQRLEEGDQEADELPQSQIMRELILKVSWTKTETIKVYGRERRYRFMFGTTVSFDLDKKVVILQLTTNSDGRPETEDTASQSGQRQARALLINGWIDQDRLVDGTGDNSVMPTMQYRDGAYELQNMAQRLHVADGLDVEFPNWAKPEEEA